MATTTDEDWRAIDNSRGEAWPGEAPIDFDRITVASWPKVVVLGTAQVAQPRRPVREAFQEAGRVVGARLGGSVVEFHGSGHMPHADEPTRFNALLRDVWGHT
jgi:pimeloyl-ACP methyl ester carboxylesterase